MMKYLKMIAMLKDIRSEVQEKYGTGKILGVFLSRKFWGLAWLFGGYILREFAGVDFDQATIEHGADLMVLVVSYGAQGFGIAMQVVSYGKTVKAAFARVREV
jgi:hypothetical protein